MTPRKARQALTQQPGGEQESGEAAVEEGFSEDLVLAGIARAECHTAAPGVVWHDIVAHLGLVGQRDAAHGVREPLAALREAGAIRESQLGGAFVWDLSAKGRRRLARARRAGHLLTLPEAPQHASWREAHQAARENLQGLRNQLQASLKQAQRNLGSRGGGDAMSWVTLLSQLTNQCAELAWATYCLNEWPEPDDDTRDTPLRARRQQLGINIISTI
jgi:DNA-binding transcriptional regulator PaaX